MLYSTMTMPHAQMSSTKVNVLPTGTGNAFTGSRLAALSASDT